MSIIKNTPKSMCLTFFLLSFNRSNRSESTVQIWGSATRNHPFIDDGRGMTWKTHELLELLGVDNPERMAAIYPVITSWKRWCLSMFIPLFCRVSTCFYPTICRVSTCFTHPVETVFRISLAHPQASMSYQFSKWQSMGINGQLLKKRHPPIKNE